jgi:hypothetical protein
MHTRIGAAGGEAGEGTCPVERRQGFLQGLLDGRLAPLALPAVESGPVVLQAKGDAPQAILGVVGRGGAQTSSMIAISALSPRRRTVRTMRV